MRIKFLGLATFEIITSCGKRLLIDPFIDENPYSQKKVGDFQKLDILFITHGAYDHFGDAIEIAENTNTKIVCGPEVKKVMVESGINGERIINLAWGLTTKIDDIIIRAVESRHASFIETKEGQLLSGFPLGFIIDDGNTKLYNASDTALFSDMKLIGRFEKPDIGLINVSVPRVYSAEKQPASPFITGEMTGKEAALAAKWLELKYAIACHYEDPEATDVKTFIETLEKDKKGPKPLILKPGQEYIVETR